MATFYTCGRSGCLRTATVAQQEIDRLRTALAQAERENEKLQHDIHQYVQIASDLVAERDEARGLLRELSEEYFDGMADADQPHGAESPIPNEEMEWQMRIDAHLRDTGE